MVHIDSHVCTGCTACVDACPGDIIRMRTGKATPAYGPECSCCFQCQFACPSYAIAVKPTKKLFKLS